MAASAKHDTKHLIHNKYTSCNFIYYLLCLALVNLKYLCENSNLINFSLNDVVDNSDTTKGMAGYISIDNILIQRIKINVIQHVFDIFSKPNELYFLFYLTYGIRKFLFTLKLKMSIKIPHLSSKINIYWNSFMKEQLWFIHMLRSVACLLVIYKHIIDNFWVTNLYTTKQYHLEISKFYYQSLVYHKCIEFINSIFSVGSIGVALFFLVSGFVIPLSLKSKGKIQFLIARFFRIWPVYISGFTFTLLIMFSYKKFFNATIDYNFTLKHIAINMLPIQRLLGGQYFIGVFWTLELEIKFYLITALLWWLFGNLNKSRYIILFGFIMLVMALFRFVTLDTKSNIGFINFLSENIIHCSPFYLTYMYIGTCFYNHYEKTWSFEKTLISTLILLLICIYINYYYHPSEWKNLCISAYIHALILFSTFYYYRYKIPHSRIIEFFGNISYPLYLLHSQNGYIIMSIVYYYTANPYISLSVALFILTILSYILHTAIELPFQLYGKNIEIEILSRIEKFTISNIRKHYL